jgi:NAD(P)-dependent dehydrogenase (short-subunit alcohol dehydrogenase family)
MAVALVTGASKGLGRALARGLAEEGWSLVLEARGGEVLEGAAGDIRAALTGGARLSVITGDVADAGHRRLLVAAAEALGGLDLVVNNASTLGPTPLPDLVTYPLDGLRRAFEVNVVAPLALVQLAAPLLRRSARPAVLNITSDAAVEPYPGWGGYGSSKAALEQLSAVLAVEEPTFVVWAVDPGDMRTQMHQDAFPGEDISDRPLPDVVAPGLVRLIGSDLPSGRYRAADLAATPARL